LQAASTGSAALDPHPLNWVEGTQNTYALCFVRIKTAQRYAHLSHDTLLDATNSVNSALGGMFVPMVSASPAAQVQLVQ
jgi:hypothetical protein